MSSTPCDVDRIRRDCDRSHTERGHHLERCGMIEISSTLEEFREAVQESESSSVPDPDPAVRVSGDEAAVQTVPVLLQDFHPRTTLERTDPLHGLHHIQIEAVQDTLVRARHQSVQIPEIAEGMDVPTVLRPEFPDQALTARIHCVPDTDVTAVVVVIHDAASCPCPGGRG